MWPPLNASYCRRTRTQRGLLVPLLFVLLLRLVEAQQLRFASVTVSESTPLGTCIFNFTQPSGAPLPASATCFPTGIPQLVVDNTLKCLKVGTPLDYETSSSSTNAAYTPLISCTTVRWSVQVYLTPEDDNAPQITLPKSATVQEGTAPNSGVISFDVKDADKDSGAVNVTVDPTSDPGKEFFIVKTSADGYDLKLAHTPDYEKKKLYTLVVVATDSAHRVTATINVSVTDVNDNAPLFTQRSYIVPVAENVSLNSPVIQLQATDADSAVITTLVFSIAPTDPVAGPSLLAVEASSGAVRTNHAPLPVGLHKYSVTVRDGVFFDTVELVLTVVDVNDQPPVITRSCLHSEEFEEPGPPVGTIVCTFVIDDADHGANGRVNVNLDGGKGVFVLSTTNTVNRITPFNVSVALAKFLDYENTTMFHLSLKASDNGQPPQRAALGFTVYVNDSNEFAPKFTQDVYRTSIAENAMSNELVEAVGATDPDGSSSAISYRIIKVSDPRANGWLHIDSSTGLVKVSAGAVLNRELLPSFTIVVEAEDIGIRNGRAWTLASTANVTVTLLDVNDNAPSFTQTSFNGSVVENAVDGTPIVQLSADDPDEGANGTVTFSLTTTRGGSAFPFTVDSHGQVKVAAGGSTHLDRENISSYTLTATASDLGSPAMTSSVPVHIIVMDVNDNPPTFYPLTYQCNIVENAGPGRVCTTVRASDPDLGVSGQVVFSIVGGNTGVAFLINRTSGLLTTRQSLDREKVPSYILVIRAVDGLGVAASQDAVVRVDVKNVRDQEPIFSQREYAFTVLENATLNSTVGQVNASSQDLSDNPPSLIYSIAGGDPGGHFTIGRLTGRLYVASMLDRELDEFFRLVIGVEEPGPPSLYATTRVNITVGDINDSPPSFGKTTDAVKVPECFLTGVPFYQANATDPDTGKAARVRYSVLNSTGDGFAIDRFSGVVTMTKSVLDHERATQVFVLIKAADRGETRLSSTMTLYINVQVRG